VTTIQETQPWCPILQAPCSDDQEIPKVLQNQLAASIPRISDRASDHAAGSDLQEHRPLAID
jgi:hypothetical protein